MAKKIALFTLAAALFASSCAGEAPAGREVSMFGLNPASAERDARRAMELGDFRLLAVAGFSVETPGCGVSILVARENYGVIEIEGTSDFHQWPGETWLNDRARDYAERYNCAIVSARPL